MIQILVCTAMIVGGFTLAIKVHSYSGWENVGVSICGLGGILLVGLLISLPISRASGRDGLVRVQAFRDSVQRARNDKNFSDIERAAILKEITSWNEWLASERYWNVGIWDWWHVDEVTATEDLR